MGHVVEIGGIRARVGARARAKRVELKEIKRNAEMNTVRCADPEAAVQMQELIKRAKREGDSVGGIVEVIATGVPPGLGEPVFDKLDAELAKALMSIGAVKGVEIGAGFGAARMRGSEMNDEFYIDTEDGRIRTRTNNAGGILGGISTGEPVICRVAVKPTPSIAKPQRSVDMARMEDVELRIRGRHDPCICPRIVPVAEAMVALVLIDYMMIMRGGRLETMRQK